MLRAVIPGSRRTSIMTLLPKLSYPFSNSTLESSFQRRLGENSGSGFLYGPTYPCPEVLLSDHLGRDNRCTHRFLLRESSVLVKLRPHPLPGQVSADSKSLPQGTWGSLWREALSPTPETTHPLTLALPDLLWSSLHPT